MAHDKLSFPMPASASVVFDAFHYHGWRARWDSLVGHTSLENGADCPSVGAISTNKGATWMRGLAMQTRFIQYDRPHIAAATMLAPSFPFTRWAASMQHRDVAEGQSVLVYTYTFEVRPIALRWLLEPVVGAIFARQTRRRFAHLQAFLTEHAGEVQQWQLQGSPPVRRL